MLTKEFRARPYHLFRLICMIGGWWLLFLIQNTNNPWSRLLNMPAESFFNNATLIDYLIYIGSYLLIMVISIGLGYLGLGHYFSQLNQKLTRRIWLMTAMFIVFFAIMYIVGTILITIIPDTFWPDVPESIADVQFESWLLWVTNLLVSLFKIVTQQLFILTPVALSMSYWNKWSYKVGLLAYLIVIGGVLSTTTTEGAFVFGIVLYGLVEVAIGWYYIATKNLMLTILITWICYQVISILI